MFLRRVIHLAPDDQPKESEQPGQDKREAPAPSKIHSQYDERSDRSSDGRSTVKQCGCQSSLALWKPFRNGLCGSRPVGGLGRSQQTTKRCKAVKPPRQRGGNGNDRIQE